MAARLSRRSLFASLLASVSCLATFGHAENPAVAVGSDDPLERCIAVARGRPEWAKARTAAERLHVIREVALGFDVVSDPVSDRYLITRFGGPIDLVHFLALAIHVGSGQKTLEEALMFQWRDEGGEDYEAGRTRSFPTEAHPDDLPSNALGALFGAEFRDRNAAPPADFDVSQALRDFLHPLGIVEDSVAKRFSHRTIVMGLSDGANRRLDTARREWFTAKPLFILPLVDPQMAAKIADARAGLRRAGFVLIEIEQREIGIARVAAADEPEAPAVGLR